MTEIFPASSDAVSAPSSFNVVNHFVDRHLREGRGETLAILCEERRMTYGEFAAEVNRVGNGLRRLGLEEEQRVLLVVPDTIEFAAAYFGAMKIGAVPVPTNTTLRAADYAYFLEETRAKVLIVHSSLLAEVQAIIPEHKHLRSIVVCGDEVGGFLAWDQWLGDCSPELESVQTSKDDVAFWLWTSGSTGKPKAAVHLHHDWIHCCEGYARGILDIHASDVTFSSSPLFHAYGLGNGLMFPFHVGAATVLSPHKPHAKQILEIAQATRPTLFFSVPTLYAAMLQELNHGVDYDLSSVRLAVSAAEPLAAEIYRRWKEKFNMEILDGIGSTEVLHIYISARPGQARPGSSGVPVPGYEVKIVDADGQMVPTGAIGELLVAGDSTAQHYWNRRQLTRDRMHGKWFFTGDTYRVDGDGYYWYEGRSDDMFRVSGQWVSPIEVESALMEHKSVLEAAVIALVEDNRLVTPKALVVLKEGFAGSRELVSELQDYVKNRISPYKYPRHIEFIADLPKTAAGKLQRFKLREPS